METIAVQVARGAEWLDATCPGWEDKVDTELLDMRTCCVLDQTLDGGFLYYYMSKSPWWCSEHGFGLHGREEWIATIEARRAEKRVPVVVHEAQEVSA